MQILLESQRRRWLSLGPLLSLALHVLIVGAVVFAYRRSPDVQDSMERRVVFLAPPDRPIGGSTEIFQETLVEETGAVESDPPSSDAVALGTGPLLDEVGADTQAVASEEIVRQELLQGSVLSEIEVDSTVRREPTSAAPEYPLELLRSGVEGSAFVLFVVDSTGLVDVSTYRVVRATHPWFALAVRDALPRMKFRPAILDGVPVPQLVEQSFAFQIRASDSIPPAR